MEFFKRKKTARSERNFDNSNQVSFPIELKDFLHSLEQTDNHPVYFAFEGFGQLKSEAKNDEELALFLLEDIIFSSLYTSFCEQFFIELNNSDLNLINNFVQDFEEGSPERERVIAQQTEAHVQYIINQGHCDGCNFCSSHNDLKEMLEKWNDGRIEYFMELYLGMQTIQSFFDQVLYDYLPQNPEIVQKLSMETIDKVRSDLVQMAKEETDL